MSEGWSVDERNPWVPRTDLIPSNGPNNHPDPRMHLELSDVRLVNAGGPSVPSPWTRAALGAPK